MSLTFSYYAQQAKKGGVYDGIKEELWTRRSMGQTPNAEEGQKVSAFHTSWTAPKGQSITSCGMCTSLPPSSFYVRRRSRHGHPLVALLPDAADPIVSLDGS